MSATEHKREENHHASKKSLVTSTRNTHYVAWDLIPDSVKAASDVLQTLACAYPDGDETNHATTADDKCDEGDDANTEGDDSMVPLMLFDNDVDNIQHARAYVERGVIHPSAVGTLSRLMLMPQTKLARERLLCLPFETQETAHQILRRGIHQELVFWMTNTSDAQQLLDACRTFPSLLWWPKHKYVEMLAKGTGGLVKSIKQPLTSLSQGQWPVLRYVMLRYVLFDFSARQRELRQLGCLQDEDGTLPFDFTKHDNFLLKWCAKQGHIEMVRLMLLYRDGEDFIDLSSHMDAVTNAIRHGHSNILHMMLQWKGPDGERVWLTDRLVPLISVSDCVQGSLLEACRNGFVSTVRQVLQWRGADGSRVKLANNFILRSHVCTNGRIKVLKLLLQWRGSHGNKAFCNENKDKLLQQAFENGHSAIAQLLWVNCEIE